MKKVLLLSIITLFTFQLFSQVDLKAKTILDKVSEKTKNYPSITASFEFTMQNDAAGLKEVNAGSLILQKDKYKLSISDIEIYSDGKTLWTYMREANEVNISEANAGGEEESINPATIFTIYEKGFKNIYLGEFTNGTKKTHKVELTPTGKMEFSKLILEIDQATNQIMNAKMFSKDGNIFIINVKSFVTTNNYPISTFIFDPKKHTGIEVIDMR